jgi:hypothetical protein
MLLRVRPQECGGRRVLMWPSGGLRDSNFEIRSSSQTLDDSKITMLAVMIERTAENVLQHILVSSPRFTEAVVS